jgi:hypothetical protein
MDLNKVLAQLRDELQNLEAAIESLERLKPEGPRRGRPPKSLAERAQRLGAAKTGSDLRSMRGHIPE